MKHKTVNETYDTDRPGGNGRGFFDPAKVAAASAAAAAAIHHDDDGGFREDLVRASLQGELDRIASTNEVRKRHGLSTIDDVWIGAIVHDCLPGSDKPWHNPNASPLQKAVNGYWRCDKDAHGCYSCFWVEHNPVAEGV